jgi:hypothetical protein
MVFVLVKNIFHLYIHEYENMFNCRYGVFIGHPLNICDSLALARLPLQSLGTFALFVQQKYP